MKRQIMTVFVALMLVAINATANVRLKDLGRLDGVEENPLVGYGLVVGLAGTGDSINSQNTIQSTVNTLHKLGVNVDAQDVKSRNVASVIVTAKLPAYGHVGDKIDVSVSSLGDARSLVGGTLLMAPLKAANDKIYALAQGPVSVGGFQYDGFGNLQQKNHPTVGLVPNGGTVERQTTVKLVREGELSFLLNSADFTTASRIKLALNQHFDDDLATVATAGKIQIKTSHVKSDELSEFISAIEKVTVAPDTNAKVVINERTGTIVSGSQVQIDAVDISQGSLRISINTDYQVSQPTFLSRPNRNIRTAVVPDSEISVEEGEAPLVNLQGASTVGDLVQGLNQVGASTRDVIAVLQSIKAAGALHAELIII